ncbi:MAG: FAD-dependent oxidoreductase, partial [Oscillospiraceae bacterium]|nr:FAD-dependent oxidoreductase [Oscillospiraceae bacterium]
IIYAAGAYHGKLGLEREEELRGRGVSYCATCDGTFYRGKKVAVIGGGDTALKDALYLSKICERVTLVHRRKEFRGQERYLRSCEETENIEIIRGAVCEEIYGEKKVTGIGLIKDNGAGVYVQCDGLFIAVGMVPETEVMQGFCDMDKNGYIIAGEDCVTSAPGIFAAGDVRTKEFRQIVTAVADGANAARSAALYILDMEKPEVKDEEE